MDDGETATTALGRRCAVTVDDSVAWWRSVELGGVRSVRRNPRVGQQQNVEIAFNVDEASNIIHIPIAIS